MYLQQIWIRRVLCCFLHPPVIILYSLFHRHMELGRCWRSANDDRAALLHYVLRSCNLHGGWTIKYPNGCNDVARIDFNSIDVPAVLDRLQNPPAACRILDLSECTLVPTESRERVKVFCDGWRDFNARLLTSDPRVIPDEESAGEGGSELSLAEITGIPTAAAKPKHSDPEVPHKNDDESYSPTEVPAKGSFTPGEQNVPEDIDVIEEEFGLVISKTSMPQEAGCAEVEKHDIPFPEPMEIVVYPVVPRDLYGQLESDVDLLNSVVYDQLLLCVCLFLTPERKKLGAELLEIVRPALGISGGQHYAAMDDLAPSNLSLCVIKSSKSSDIGKLPCDIPQGIDVFSVLRPSMDYLKSRKVSDSLGNRIAAVKSIPFIQEAMSDGRSDRTYPLLFRALIYAGLLTPLFHPDTSCACDDEDIQNIVPFVGKILQISPGVASCARVHSIMMRYRAVGDESTEAQVACCEALVEALQHMADETLLHEEANPQCVQYRHYVLQKVFDFVVPPLVNFQEVQNPSLFTALCEAFAVAADASSLHFLARCLCSQFTSVTNASSTEQVTTFIISHMLCAPMYRELEGCRDQMDDLQAIPLEDLLKMINELYDSVAPYGELWSKVVPHCGGLLAAGMIRLYAAALHLHWVQDVQKENSIPETFAPTMELVGDLIKTLIKPHMESTMIAVNIHAAMEDLDWIKQYFVKRKIAAIDKELGSLIEAMLMNTCWFNAKLEDGPHSSSLDIFAMFYQLLPPLPDLMVPKSVEVIEWFLEVSLERMAQYAQRVVGPFDMTSRVAAMEEDPNVKRFGGYLKTRALSTAKVGRFGSLFKNVSLAEVVLRLNTLIALRDNLYKFFEKMYEKADGGTANLTGGFPLDTRDKQRKYRLLIEGYISDICDFLGMRVIYHDVGATLTDRLYAFDYKFYKANKSNKKLLAEDPHAHMIFANDLTVSKVMQIVDASLMVFMPFISSIAIREKVVLEAFLYCLVAHFNVLIDGGDERFFYAEQSTSFFNDLCYIETFFLNALSDHAKAKAEERTPVQAFLSGYKCVISLLMAQSSEALIEGSEMGPKYSELPEHSPTSPFSKWMIRKILAHRKDSTAKRFIESHPDRK